jgi:hypothetical protein
MAIWASDARAGAFSVSLLHVCTFPTTWRERVALESATFIRLPSATKPCGEGATSVGKVQGKVLIEEVRRSRLYS